MNKETQERIRLMEFYYDTLWAAVTAVPHALHEDGPLSDMLKNLVDYYDNGQWRADYERDECGELPPDLKRGVLSEDGVYDLLSEIQNIEEK